MAFATNPNLPASYVKPVVAVSIDVNAPAASGQDEASTVLLWTEQLPAGVAPLNSVSSLLSVTDAVNFYGKRSPAVRMLRALLSAGLSGVRVRGVGVVQPAAGVAGTFRVAVTITGADGSAATNPLSAGGLSLTLGGSEVASVSWGTSDTATSIGAALADALNQLEFVPFGTFANDAGVVTATSNLKGAALEDYPLRVEYSREGTGVKLGPGSLTLSGAPSGSAGSLTLTTGATSVVVAVDPATETTAALALDEVVAVLGGWDSTGAFHQADGSYPLQAGRVVPVPYTADAVLPLHFSPGCDCRRVSARLVTVGTTTTQLDGGDEVVAGSTTYAGTPGSGYPSLSGAVAAVRMAGSFGQHVVPWFDAATAGAVFAAVVSDGDGAPSHQKGQKVVLGATGTQAVATALLSATTPAMTSAVDNAGLRGVVLSCPDAPHPGAELAARVAALRASSMPFTNYDGLPLRGTAEAPVLLPSQLAVAAFDDASQNTAIADGLTPLAAVDGQLVVILGRSTIATTANELWDWSWVDQADYHRRDLRAQAAGTFRGAALIANGAVPQSRRDVDPAALRSFLRALLRRWEAQGTYDGAEVLGPLCDAQVNPSVRSRADLVYPESPKVPLHQLGVVALRQSPTTP